MINEEKYEKLTRQTIATINVQNAIALAASMDLDITNPSDALKVKRQLPLLHSTFGGVDNG